MKPAMGGDIIVTAPSGEITAAIATAVKKWFLSGLLARENPPKFLLLKPNSYVEAIIAQVIIINIRFNFISI